MAKGKSQDCGSPGNGVIHGHSNRQPGAGLVLVGQGEARGQTGIHRQDGLAGQIRVIVLFAQMSQQQAGQMSVGELVDQFRRLMVAQVAKITTHPRPEKGRIGAVPKHLGIMITFQHQGIAFA